MSRTEKASDQTITSTQQLALDWMNNHGRFEACQDEDGEADEYPETAEGRKIFARGSLNALHDKGLIAVESYDSLVSSGEVFSTILAFRLPKRADEHPVVVREFPRINAGYRTSTWRVGRWEGIALNWLAVCRTREAADVLAGALATSIGQPFRSVESRLVDLEAAVARLAKAT